MSYLTQSRLAADPAILQRVTACAANEQLESPQSWAFEHAWQLSAQPGWAAAYASAVLAHGADPDTVPPPGENEAAITDGMILAAVNTLNTSSA